jgi:hypothetical protein
MSETIGVYKIESQGIKSATKETKDLKKEVKEVNNEAKDTLGNFRMFGVSLNDIGAGFTKMKGIAKASFATIRAGLISTGIGAFVVAIGSLAGFFTNTKRGADKFNVALTGIRATFDVLRDRVSSFGEGLTLIFSGDFKEGADLLKNSFTGIVDEIKNESQAMMDLKVRTNELRDAENDFMIQKAETRKQIEQARLLAEDESLSAAERLKNLKLALDLEEQTTKRELELARERMKIKEEEMKLSENSAEDERELAQLKTQVINAETNSARLRRRVITEVNALQNEINTEEQNRLKEQMALQQELIDLEQQRLDKLTTTATTILDKFYNSQLDAEQQQINAVYDKYFAIIEGQKQLGIDTAELTEAQESEIQAIRDRFQAQRDKQREADTDAEKKATQAKNDAIIGGLSSLASATSTLAGDNKALAVASATIDTYAGATKAFAQGGVAGFLTSAAVIVAGLANVRKILSTKIKGNGGGGGGNAPTPTNTPAPRLVSGNFELGGTTDIEPQRAYVVSDDITNNQNKLANIRRRATI